jgi:uncharacterized protein YjdB
METKICSFCGLEYPATEEKCPLCGHYETLPEEDEYVEPTPAPRPTQQKRSGRRTGARVAPSSSRIPRWLTVLTCLILALAVVIFVLFLLSYTGVFDRAPASDVSGSLDLPVEDETQPTDTVEPDTVEPTQETVLCTGLTLNTSTYFPSSVGETYQLVATLVPSDCTEEIFWSSSNALICSVSDDGLITVLSNEDDATITASCGAYSATCYVEASALATETTSDPDAEHSISSEDITFFSAGESTTLRLSNTESGDQITWQSADESLVVVSSDGKVTAVAPGTTNVTATLNGKTYTCIVRCNFTNSDSAESGSETAETGRYTLSHEDVTLHYLENETFRLTLSGYDGTVIWSTSDASVCTVSDSIVTAQGAGTANITAIVGGQTYTCVVRCIQ